MVGDAGDAEDRVEPQSSHTPSTMNTDPKLNDSDRTRAGDTNACVVKNAGVNMPPMNVVTQATRNSHPQRRRRPEHEPGPDRHQASSRPA